MNNPWFSKIAVWLVIGMVLFTVFKQFDNRSGVGSGYMGYSDFLEEVRGNRIKSAIIQEGQGDATTPAVFYVRNGVAVELRVLGIYYKDLKSKESTLGHI